MSNARNIARLLPNTSGQLPTSNLQDSAVSLNKVADAAVGRSKIGYSGSVLQTIRTYYNTQFSMSSGTVYDLNVGITITPTSSNSKILLMGYGHADDNSSTSWGIGLGITCTVAGTERWYSHQGSHHTYISGSADHYLHADIWELDDGTGHEGANMPIVAGQARYYRLYGFCHNDGCRWNANSISQNAATMSRSPGSSNVYGTRFVVMEISG
jgi:hypothetical protein